LIFSEEDSEKESPFPRDFDVNPRVTIMGKLRLLYDSALGFLTSW
jgi:hypothetical protein